MATLETLRKRTLKLTSSDNDVGIYDQLAEATERVREWEARHPGESIIDTFEYDPDLDAHPRSMAYRMNEAKRRISETR